MADQKISQLSDGGTSQAADEYVIARSGANYRIDGASVAAAATSVGTLSSLTVSGDLTVDTNTLKVDSANNRVGIGTASPSVTLETVGGTGAVTLASFRTGDSTAANNAGIQFLATSSATASSRSSIIVLDPDGANVAGSDYFSIQKLGNNGVVSLTNFSASAMTFGTDAATKMTLDASGNVGIGTTSPTQLLDVRGNIFVDSANGTLTIRGGDATNQQQIRLRMSGTDGVLDVTRNSGTAPNLIFGTEGTERARITSGGALLVNATAAIGTEQSLFKQSAGSGSPILRAWNNATTADNEFIEFATEASYTSRGNITYNRGAGQVAYNVTSDERLKENIADAEDVGAMVDAMQVRQFDWKETGNHLDYGFVAQELHAIAPQAVTVPEDENKFWSVDYSKLVPMLVKEIQSLRARVAVLEA